jgi:CHAT domain-containing protein/tetratricopeptide (TPR) repeat protein
MKTRNIRCASCGFVNQVPRNSKRPVCGACLRSLPVGWSSPGGRKFLIGLFALSTTLAAASYFGTRYIDGFTRPIASANRGAISTEVDDLDARSRRFEEPPEAGNLEALNNRVNELYRAGKYADAVPLAERYAEATKMRFGAEDTQYATALSNLALLYKSQGRTAEAEPLFKRSLAINEKALGPDHPYVGMDLNNLAELYIEQGRPAEAEPLLERALAITEKALGSDHLNVGAALNNLAQLYESHGRTAEAEPLYKRALAIAEKALGPDDPNVGATLNNLAELYRGQGRYAEAEPLYNRALGIDEKALGLDHPSVGTDLNNLALLYQAQGRYTQAEPLLERALTITEKALGPDHPNVGTRLNNLAELYRVQGRYAEAEPLYKRARAIDERRLGPDHPNVARDLNNLAALYHAQGRAGETEPLYKRALAIAEKALGPDHADVGAALNNLAEFYRVQGRDAEADPLLKRALAIDEKALGPDHPSVGTDLNNLALLYQAQGRYTQAEPLMKRALAIDEKALGPDHPDVGRDLNNLASLYFSQGDSARAADYLRRSTGVITRRAQRGTLVVGEALTGKRKSEAEQQSERFWALVKVVHRLALERRNDTSLRREMFQTTQWARSSEAAASLAQMAARGAKGDPKLATLVRERQDLVAEWQNRDALRSAAVSQAPDKRNAQTETQNVARLAAIDTTIADIDREIAAKFPDYAVLASPAPLSVEDAQKQLGADEALVLFLDTPESKSMPEETFVWVVTKSDVKWVRSEFGTPALSREVAALRCGLDYEAWRIGSRCPDLLKVSYSLLDRAQGTPLPFDLARANKLYTALFREVEDLIKNKQLLIVPSGPLTQLPFQVLVTEPPTGAKAGSAIDHRNVAWLARTHALTVLPAVSSLKALREFAKQSRASEPYIGFGDPLLEGDPTKFQEDAAAAKLAREKRCDPTPRQNIASLIGLRGGARAVSRDGGTVDVADLKTWAPLPETADEICDVAHDLGVDPATHVYLGASATETKIKQLSNSGTLAKNRIVHFATHGAVAGDLSGTSEPGLILTPPEKASEVDDGYLSASEVAALKLDADWVILSACNTAAGDAKGAEALSGLARAFFYAGARSLLVSHWEVSSDATVKLITKAVAELKANPKIGRAEALRRSMLAMIDHGKAYEAHPAFWAPFVLVGEGAR